ncbi:hypothetical protein, conserved [Eimeria necatrix]|uniref:Uncharacterized protein n=1 Tax=Eimeria necatrix TaxID=51315 RepID=U6MZM2_9EIME|nr:hypothetical protein, conserved [Eimeria necatrix]CDJ68503.1 hypothetical protein, conserved [Eimeria necatrix]
MDCKNVLMSEGVVEPLFQLLVHKVTIEKFDLLRDLGTREHWASCAQLLSAHSFVSAKKKALPDCPEDSEGGYGFLYEVDYAQQCTET